MVPIHPPESTGVEKSVEKMTEETPPFHASKKKGKSRVSNGATLHAGIDGRSVHGRRFRDLVESLSEDIPILDESARSLVRRTAGLIVEAERLEGLIVSNQDFPRENYVTLVGALNRCQDRLNELKKEARYWISEKEKAERAAWLDSLTAPELRALRDKAVAQEGAHSTTAQQDLAPPAPVPCTLSQYKSMSSASVHSMRHSHAHTVMSVRAHQMILFVILKMNHHHTRRRVTSSMMMRSCNQ